MSAERLRAAAALLRERAEAFDMINGVTSPVADWIEAANAMEATGVTNTAEALVVADWLDTVADAILAGGAS